MADLSAEERARAIINSGEYLYAVEQIREAEQRGAEREREACAKIAMSFWRTEDSSTNRPQTADAIARAIRARKAPEQKA